MNPDRKQVEEFIRANFKKGFNPDQYAFKVKIDEKFGDIRETVDNILKDMFRRHDGMCFFLDQVVPNGLEPLLNGINNALEKFGCFEIIGMFEHVRNMFNANAVHKAEHFEDFLMLIYPGLRTFCFRTHTLMTLSDEDTNRILNSMTAEVERTVRDDYHGLMKPLNVRVEFFAFSSKSVYEITKQYSDMRLDYIDGNVTIETLNTDDFPENLNESVNAVISRIREADLEMDLDTICLALSLSLGYNFKKRHNLENPTSKNVLKKLISENYCGEPPMTWYYDSFRPKED